MHTTKLTLNIDASVIKQAKQIAAAANTSVSALFSQFVQSLAAARTKPVKIGPLTRQLSGIVKLPRGKDYKDVLADALQKKY